MTHDDLRTQGQSNVLQQKGAALGGLGSMSSHGICAACLGLGTSLNTKPGSAGNCDVASCIKSRALGRRTAPDPNAPVRGEAAGRKGGHRHKAIDSQKRHEHLTAMPEHSSLDQPSCRHV